MAVDDLSYVRMRRRIDHSSPSFEGDFVLIASLSRHWVGAHHSVNEMRLAEASSFKPLETTDQTQESISRQHGVKNADEECQITSYHRIKSMLCDLRHYD